MEQWGVPASAVNCCSPDGPVGASSAQRTPPLWVLRLKWGLNSPWHNVGVAFYLIFMAGGLAGAVVMFKLLRGIKLI